MLTLVPLDVAIEESDIDPAVVGFDIGISLASSLAWIVDAGISRRAQVGSRGVPFGIR